jgi:hypothetical protein
MIAKLQERGVEKGGCGHGARVAIAWDFGTTSMSHKRHKTHKNGSIAPIFCAFRGSIMSYAIALMVRGGRRRGDVKECWAEAFMNQDVGGKSDPWRCFEPEGGLAATV